MVLVEVILRKKMILIGPFDDRKGALVWIDDLIRENPGEIAVVAVNDNQPGNLRVYIGDPQAEDAEEDLVSPVFELFRE